jgi:hypothetical protein
LIAARFRSETVKVKGESMVRLPEDLENELIAKYPEANVKAIIQSMFLGIIDKTLKDGGCIIREFGNFKAFRTHSAKLATDVIRFKFSISPALEKKIKFDTYLLNNIPIKAKVPFTEEHQKKCSTDIKLLNVEASSLALKNSQQKTREKTMSNLVTAMLND